VDCLPFKITWCRGIHGFAFKQSAGPAARRSY
jgi:hypothetical protein